MSVETTTVQIDMATRDRLRAAKVGGETYDDVLNRLLDRVEGTEATA